MRVLLAPLLVTGLLVAAPAAHGAWMQPSKLAIALPSSDPTVRFAADDPGAAQGQETPGGGHAGDIVRSLAIPGWGQWRQGYRAMALGFFTMEAAIWTTYFVSVGQGKQRRNTYQQTALLFAGIDLTTVDKEFRKRLSRYMSSDEYNRLVVMREAANLYFGDPAAYNQYIEEHSLKGNETWEWESEAFFLRYAEEVRSSERAYQRAEFALAAAVVNRLISGLAAWRMGPKAQAPSQSHSPVLETPRGRLEWTLVPGETGVPGHRMAWVVDF